MKSQVVDVRKPYYGHDPESSLHTYILPSLPRHVVSKRQQWRHVVFRQSAVDQRDHALFDLAHILVIVVAEHLAPLLDVTGRTVQEFELATLPMPAQETGKQRYHC